MRRSDGLIPFHSIEGLQRQSKKKQYFLGHLFLFIVINENLCTDSSINIHMPLFHFISLHPFQRSTSKMTRVNENSAPTLTLSTSVLSLRRNAHIPRGKVKTSSDNICVAFWPVAKFIGALTVCTNLDKLILSLPHTYRRVRNQPMDVIVCSFFFFHYSLDGCGNVK